MEQFAAFSGFCLSQWGVLWLGAVAPAALSPCTNQGGLLRSLLTQAVLWLCDWGLQWISPCTRSAPAVTGAQAGEPEV